MGDNCLEPAGRQAGMPLLKEGRQQKTDMSRMRANKEEVDATGDDYAANEKDKLVPVTVGPKIGRNDPCPCGSGKKYKHCHGKEA